METAVIQNAINYVQELGAQDRKEHLAGVAANGDIKFIAHGGDHAVEFNGQDMTGVKYIVHNHPIAAALSAQDIGMATLQGVTVVCVTPSGSIFASKGALLPDVSQEEQEAMSFTKMGRRLLEHAKLNVIGGLQNAEQNIGQELVFRTKVLHVMNEDPNTLASHFANMIFKDAGMIDYEFILSKQDAEMYRRNNEFFNKRAGKSVSLT